jgi:hypothetical protein
MIEIAAPVESPVLSCTDPILSSCANPGLSLVAEVTTAITEFSSARNAIGMGFICGRSEYFRSNATTRGGPSSVPMLACCLLPISVLAIGRVGS